MSREKADLDSAFADVFGHENTLKKTWFKADWNFIFHPAEKIIGILTTMGITMSRLPYKTVKEIERDLQYIDENQVINNIEVADAQALTGFYNGRKLEGKILVTIQKLGAEPEDNNMQVVIYDLDARKSRK